MNYDIFISYSRRDNADGWVTALIDALQQQHAQATGGSQLRVFLDTSEIPTMVDWDQRIRVGLRNSKLFVACVSPSYFSTQYCRLEWQLYLEHELDRGLAGEGIAPIYFVDVPGYETGDCDQQIADWVQNLSKRRQYLDLRSWFPEGPGAFLRDEIRVGIATLDQQIDIQLGRATRAAKSPGTVPPHNRDFTGRAEELRQLRQALFGGRIGVVASLHGLGGMGKSALAFEYAHDMAADYPGGRWLLPAEGQGDLREALRPLGRMLGFEFTGEENGNLELLFVRLCTEIGHRERMLVLLDNVDQPQVLSPSLISRLPANQIHVFVTSRLAPSEVPGENKTCLSLDELPSADALRLLEKYRPFANADEQKAADQIVNILGGFALATEVIGVFLRAEGSVDYSSVLERLKSEGFIGVEGIAQNDSIALSRHRQKLLSTILAPSLAKLTPAERTTLEFAALLLPDGIPLPWLKELISPEFPEATSNPKAGYPDPWLAIVRRLDGMRLLVPASDPNLRRMHRMVQAYVTALGVHIARPTSVDVVGDCGQLREPSRQIALNFLARLLRRLPRPRKMRCARAALAIHQRARHLDVNAKKDERVNKIDPMVASRARRLEHTWTKHNARWEIEPLRAWACRGSAIPLGPEFRSESWMTRFAIQKAYLEKVVASWSTTPDHCNSNIAQVCTSLGRIEEALCHIEEARWHFMLAIKLWEHCVYKADLRLALAYTDFAAFEYRHGNRPFGWGWEEEKRAREILDSRRSDETGDFGLCFGKLMLLAREQASLIGERRAPTAKMLGYSAQLATSFLGSDAIPANWDELTLLVEFFLAGEEDNEEMSGVTRRLIGRVIQAAEEAKDPARTALAYRWMAAAEKAVGHLSEARNLLLHAIKLQELLFDPHHFELGESYTALAQVEEALSHTAEARTRWIAAAKIGQGIWFPWGQLDKWTSWNMQAAKWEAAYGNLDNARALVERIINAFSGLNKLGSLTAKNNPGLMKTYVLLAEIEAQDGKLADAKSCLGKAQHIALHNYGEDHAETQKIRAQLAALEKGG